MLRSVSAQLRAKRPKRDTGYGVARDEVVLARELIVALEKVEKAAPLYPPGSPTVKGFADELFDKATSLLARAHVIELWIGADEIDYEGEVVYDGGKSDRSVA